MTFDSCLTTWHLDNWKDSDFQSHTTAVRKSLFTYIEYIKKLEHQLHHPEPKVYCENCGETCPEKYLRCKHKGCHDDART
jgi:hypothetical protein